MRIKVVCDVKERCMNESEEFCRGCLRNKVRGFYIEDNIWNKVKLGLRDVMRSMEFKKE